MHQRLAKVVTLVMLVSMFFMLVLFIQSRAEQGKYEIIVNDYSHTTYTANKYEIDPTTKCVSFEDVKKIKRLICGDYTISER